MTFPTQLPIGAGPMPSLSSCWPLRTVRVLMAVAIMLGPSRGVRLLAAQTGTIEGAVKNAVTGEAIAGAEVTIGGTNMGTRTATGGRFTLVNVPEGLREIRVLAIGYKVAKVRVTVTVSQSNQPIVYVDGVRVRSEGYRRNRPPFDDSNGFRGANYQASPLNDINPADVDRVEIIKGAAASTLYGTEAAAGVIQIFTKRGSAGPPRWTFETGQGFAQLRPFGTDSVPYLNLRPPGDGKGQCDNAPGAGCSWILNASRQRFSGSVSGGTSGGRGVQYFLSATSENNDGVLPLDNERKLSTRGNVRLTLSDNLRGEG